MEKKDKIIVGCIIAALFLAGIFTYINYIKLSIEEKLEAQLILHKTTGEHAPKEQVVEKEEPVDPNVEEINGYKYRKSNGAPSKFKKGVIDKELFDDMTFSSQGTVFQQTYVPATREMYCTAVQELKSVDKGFVPGTSVKLENASYQDVEDAYKERLQIIAQLRQWWELYKFYNEYDNVYAENVYGCKYQNTEWNQRNKNFKAKDFEADALYAIWKEYQIEFLLK